MKTRMRALVALFPLLTAVAAHAATEASPPTRLTVHSDSDCPSAQAVTQALWAIRPDNEWPVLTATVHIAADLAHVTPREDQNQKRDIPLPPDCADRANRVAWVVAVWSGELPAHATDPPSLSVPIPAPVAASAAEPVSTSVSAPTPPPPKKSPMVALLGLAGFYSALGDLVPGAGLELGVLRRDGWWGIRASGGYQGARSQRVSMGESQYDRMLVGAAMVLQRERPRVFLSCDLGLLGAYTRAHGIGYSQDQSASGVNVGPVAEGRAGVRLGAFRVWAGVRVHRWLLTENIRIDPLTSGPSSTSTLPAWNAHLGLGAGVVFE